MNPITVFEALRDRYVSYIESSGGLSRDFPHLRERFHRLLERPGQLMKGPYLEATAPFVSSGKTAKDLVDGGLLCPEFARLFAPPAASPAKATMSKVKSTPATAKGRVPVEQLLHIHQLAAEKGWSSRATCRRTP